MIRLKILLLVILFLGCKGGTDRTADFSEQQVDSVTRDDSSTATQNGFDNYVASIPQIDLPFTFSCDSGLVWSKIDYESDVIKKYKPDGAAILGKLFEKEESVGIIYTFPADIIYPQIYIYTSDGNEASKIDLFELGDCVSDEGSYSHARGQITADLELISTIEKIKCDNGEAHCDTTRNSVRKSIH